MQGRTARWQLGKFARQQLVRGGIFVAKIDVDLGCIDDVGRDQRSLEKTMDVAQQIKAVLESPGLAFVGIDDHHSRAGLAEHRAPLAAGRETRAAKAAK